MHGKIQLANSLNWLNCRGSFSCNASTLSRSRSSYRLVRWWGSTTPFKKQMWGRHWKRWTAPREPSPLGPDGKQYQGMWLTCMTKPAKAVKVVTNAKNWLCYSWIAAISSAAETVIWGSPRSSAMKYPWQPALPPSGSQPDY